MAVCITSDTIDVISHGRLDPEYYLPVHTKVESILAKVPTESLGKIGKLSCSAFYPAATHLYEFGDMPFLRCVDIIDYPVLRPDQPFALIPQAFVHAHKSIRCLSAGDIVISKVGTPCYAGLLSEDMRQAAMTRTVLGMTDIDIEKIDKYYLIAFLRSHFGFSQLMRERELTIQYQLTLDRTRKVKVFLPERKMQEEIGLIMRSYYQGYQKSKSLYTQAQQLLEQELGLDKLNFDKPVGYEASLSEITEGRRIDAQCYKPEYINYEHYLRKNCEYQYLRSLVCPTLKGKQMPVSSSGSVNYASIKDIQGIELLTDGYCTLTSETRLAEKKDLLLAITGATIGKIGVVNRYERLAFCGDLLLLRADENIDPYYLLTVMQSPIGQSQCKRWITGSTNGHLAPHDVGKLVIPRLSNAKESVISECVKKCLRTKRESEQLLEQAKCRVEELIHEAVEK